MIPAYDGSQERVDTIKTLSMIDMFVPFLPLEQTHLEVRLALKSTPHWGYAQTPDKLIFDKNVHSF